MPNLELIELNSRAREFLSLEVAENQQGLVATMAQSYADALFPPEEDGEVVMPWLRGVIRKGEPAGFIMCAEPTQTKNEAWIWRLLVDKNHQGYGVGSFAVRSAIERYRNLGVKRLLVGWVPKDSSPASFYKKLGFIETGEMLDGEVVAGLGL